MNNYTILNCPQCKTEIPKCIEKVKIAGCPSCGCVSTVQPNGLLQIYKKLTPLSQLRVHKGYKMHSNKRDKPLYLGKMLRENGQYYTIHAIYTYYITYEEFDKETHTWRKLNGYITEWYAKSPENGRFVIFQDTDNRFYTVAKTGNNHLTEREMYKGFEEFGTFQLTAFGGVDDDDLDEKGHYRIALKKYILESATNEFKGNNYKTLAFKRLYQTELTRIQKPLNDKALEAENGFTAVSFYRNLFAAALGLVLMLMLFADGSKWGRNDISIKNTEGVGTGQKVSFSYELNAKNEFDTALIRPQKAGTFNLTAKKTYLFNAKCSLGTSFINKDIDLSASIIRKKDQVVVSEVDLAFFVESGRDDEGDWTEKTLEDELKFQVDESGMYDVFVSPDYDDITSIPFCSLTVSISETGYYYYYLIAVGGFLLAFLVCQWQREHYIAIANLPHGTYLHNIADY